MPNNVPIAKVKVKSVIAQVCSSGIVEVGDGLGVWEGEGGNVRKVIAVPPAATRVIFFVRLKF